MEIRYVVICSDGNVSYNAETESPECFYTKEQARVRAEIIAREEPGKSVAIYQLISETVCHISDPKTSLL